MTDFHEYKERPGACAECGNSPTHHLVTYVVSTLGIWQSVILQKLFRYRLFVRFERACQRFLRALEWHNFRLWERLRMIRYGRDVGRAKSYRSQVVWEEANRRGIIMEQLFFLGVPTDIYRAYLDSWMYFESLPIPPHLEQGAMQWMDDKLLLYRVLEAHGIPVPRSESVTSARAARAAFRALYGRVVIKPRTGSRARHTTTYISTEEEAARAYFSARKLCHYVLVCKHLIGPVCRGTIVNGSLVGFFQGHPPFVVGDGRSTLQQLVAARNASKPERVRDIVLSVEHAAFLARQGYDFDSVIEKEKRLELTHRTGRLFGGETRELLESVHPKLKEYLERAARILNVPVVGFDLIIENPEHDPDTQEWGVIEANSLPFIDLHYLPLYGKPSNVAAHIWDLWGRADAKMSPPSAAALRRA